MNKGLLTWIPDIGCNALGVLYLASWILVAVVAVSIPWPVKWLGAVFLIGGYVGIIVADILWRMRETGMRLVSRLLWPGAGGIIACIPAWIFLAAMPLVIMGEYWFRTRG
jgi:hypothetical protein